MPHFDQQGHYERHENIHKSRHRARRKVEKTLDDMDYAGGGNSPLFQFFLVGGALCFILGVGTFISGGTTKPVAKKKDGDDDK